MHTIYKRKVRTTKRGSNWICIQQVCGEGRHYTSVFIGRWNKNKLPVRTSMRTYDQGECDGSCGLQSETTPVSQTSALISLAQKALNFFQQSAA